MTEGENKSESKGRFVAKAAGKGAAKWGIGKITALILSGALALGGGTAWLSSDDDDDDKRPTTSQQEEDND